MVEKSLPQSVDIGPFHVNTDSVRLALAKKHKDITKALLNFLVLQLRKETEQVRTYLYKMLGFCWFVTTINKRTHTLHCLIDRSLLVLVLILHSGSV